MTVQTRHWRPTSAPGWNIGTTTPSRSCGPRPPKRSSNPSHDFAGEFQTQLVKCPVSLLDEPAGQRPNPVSSGTPADLAGPCLRGWPWTALLQRTPIRLPSIGQCLNTRGTPTALSTAYDAQTRSTRAASKASTGILHRTALHRPACNGRHGSGPSLTAHPRGICRSQGMDGVFGTRSAAGPFVWR